MSAPFQLVLVLCIPAQLFAFSSIAPLSLRAFPGSRFTFHKLGQNERPLRRTLAKSNLQMSQEDSVDPVELKETVDIEARAVDVEELKRELLVTMAGSNRGFTAIREQRQAIIDLVGQLEARNPSPAPNSDCEKLCGTWRLMFTTALDVLSLGALPLVQAGQIFQNIRETDSLEAELEVDNVVELQPATDAILAAVGASSTLELIVKARGKIVGDDRVDIAFERSNFQPKTLFGADMASFPPLSIPLNARQRAEAAGQAMSAGFITTSFLDQDMRIARGGAANVDLPSDFTNNIFVLWRDD